MEEENITFSYRDCGLTKTPEYWESASYEERVAESLEAAKAVSGALPAKNRRPVREAVFTIRETTTIEQLVGLRTQLRKMYGIEMFQAAIDRKTSEAHLLFDFINRETGECYRLNRSEAIILTVFLIRTLDLPRPKAMTTWVRYFLLSEYKDNPEVFEMVRQQINHAGLTKRTYTLVSDILAYIQLVCQGKTK